ncbi:putative protein YcbX [Zhongshania aliphaticivorans]|uniref:MOSC domain-containing protein n=1 Tax=Zhongshania aliphaticivorans TaxID=1470434 RepID=A0A5S9QMT1_9GAMM|nr:MOSC N-terminal beta barrel domain-containing protein [Zhongshania aliphaticivorans]CAA0088263.1 putative protein YcbX [Zhongshania aliphaticivorans]CAA0116237.1 putative protein YcbX [Zhongshania aliphaticivorans]CAA0120394.1 putative protein YcbX [Zhongshania aliphaticivorans]
MALTVTSLWRYPVKSMVGESLARLEVNKWGPNLDRRWMLVDTRHRFVSQRQLPMMSRLSALLTERGVRIQLVSDPGHGIDVAQPTDGQCYDVSVWSDTCSAIDAGDAPAAWLSDVLGQSVRLCFMPDDYLRQVDTAFAPIGAQVSFADGFPFLLCSTASLAALSKSLGRTLEMERFRPNIVVTGSEAFAEDAWRRLRIGDVEFDLVKPCARCAIPTINLDNGVREPDVFRMLRRERTRDGQVFFGQNLLHRGDGSITLGQEVEILK